MLFFLYVGFILRKVKKIYYSKVLELSLKGEGGKGFSFRVFFIFFFRRWGIGREYCLGIL